MKVGNSKGITNPYYGQEGRPHGTTSDLILTVIFVFSTLTILTKVVLTITENLKWKKTQSF